LLLFGNNGRDTHHQELASAQHYFDKHTATYHLPVASTSHCKEALAHRHQEDRFYGLRLRCGISEFEGHSVLQNVSLYPIYDAGTRSLNSRTGCPRIAASPRYTRLCQGTHLIISQRQTQPSITINLHIPPLPQHGIR
jgi:hypothetical protein